MNRVGVYFFSFLVMLTSKAYKPVAFWNFSAYNMRGDFLEKLLSALEPRLNAGITRY